MSTQSQNAAAILRAIRDRLNLTQEALAERLQVSFATVNRWEGSSNMPQKAAKDAIFALAIEAGLNPLPFSLPRALRVQDIAPAHPDPFDRALLAQALTEPMYLLTTDEALETYSQLVIIA